MRFQPGFEKWRSDRATIDEKTKGILWVVGVIFHWCLWTSPTQWASLALPKDRLDSFT
jgi:hypothetical protein